MKISELIKELQIRLKEYGDIPVAAHHEDDFTPFFIQDVSADVDFETGEVQYVELIVENEY